MDLCMFKYFNTVQLQIVYWRAARKGMWRRWLMGAWEKIWIDFFWTMPQITIDVSLAWLLMSAINHCWLLVEERFTWPRTGLSAVAKEKTVKCWKDAWKTETTELANCKMEKDFFFSCKRPYFAANSTYEVALGHVCLRLGCAARKRNGSSQEQPWKASISSRGEGRE